MNVTEIDDLKARDEQGENNSHRLEGAAVSWIVDGVTIARTHYGVKRATVFDGTDEPHRMTWHYSADVDGVAARFNRAPVSVFMTIDAGQLVRIELAENRRSWSRVQAICLCGSVWTVIARAVLLPSGRYRVQADAFFEGAA